MTSKALKKIRTNIAFDLEKSILGKEGIISAYVYYTYFSDLEIDIECQLEQELIHTKFEFICSQFEQIRGVGKCSLRRWFMPVVNVNGKKLTGNYPHDTVICIKPEFIVISDDGYKFRFTPTVLLSEKKQYLDDYIDNSAILAFGGMITCMSYYSDSSYSSCSDSD